MKNRKKKTTQGYFLYKNGKKFLDFPIRYNKAIDLYSKLAVKRKPGKMKNGKRKMRYYQDFSNIKIVPNFV